MQGLNALMRDTKKEMVKNEDSTELNKHESKLSIAELFPWILKFRQMCKYAYIDKSMTSLTELMQFYTRNISASVNECYAKPLRINKLKDFISETLMLFLYIYRELSEDQNRFIYLSNMSDLLALYIDIELKTSRKRTEDCEKVCARLISYLYVYLEYSVEHLLDTIMKVQFMCHSYHDILDPLMVKIIKNIPVHPETSIMYLRYFFVYCLWRRINNHITVKSQITATALTSLGPLPSTFSPSILKDVLPKVPNNEPYSTETLLQYKFDIKKHCEMFLRYCRENNGSTCQKDKPATIIDSSESINIQMLEDNSTKNVERVDNVNLVVSDNDKPNESISMLKTSKSSNVEQTNFKHLDSFSNNVSTKQIITPNIIKSNKSCLQKKRKMSNEIVIIDLTNDVAFEKCIKKRKFRKLPWLEEAKKRIDMKLGKTSQKMKKKNNEKQENIGNTHPLNVLKTCQPKETSQSSHSGEATHLKNNSHTHQILGVKDNEGNMKINVKSVDCLENTKTLIGNEVSIREVYAKTSPIAVTPLSTEVFSSTKQISKVSDVFSNNLNSGDDLNVQDEERENDRLSKQTVIKRLIDANISSQSKASEKVESFNTICDLESECPTVNNTTLSTQHHFESNTMKNEITDVITLPMNKEFELDNQMIHSTEAINYSSNVVNSEIKRKDLTVIQNYDTEKATSTNSAEYVETFQTKSVLELEQTQQLCIFNENSAKETTPELQIKSRSPKCQSKIVNMEKEEFCAQVELKSNNSEKANKGILETKSSITNSKEPIFESCSIDKKDISNTVNIMCPNENSCIDTNVNKSVDNVINNNYGNNFDKCIDKDIVQEYKMSHVSKGTLEEENYKLYKATEQENVNNNTKNKYIDQDSELRDNIDGLSLLASVSQHILHLKPESEVKCDQIKVKDYASLRYNGYNQITDDETDTNDSSHTLSQLLENPSSEIINRIVGIYPEAALNKVAFHVDVTNDARHVYNDNEICKTVSHSETEKNYETEILTHNLTPIENNVQAVKENTNVILNGETVVLLQKSPNSNLYIINKAVENSKNHSNDEEISKLKEKTWLPSEEHGQFEDITSFDHVLCNLELTCYDKELPHQETKCSIIRGKGIKMEPEDSNFSDTKPYSTKISLPSDMLSINSQIYQDVNVISKSIDKRKSPKFRQNIKQEFNNISNHITPSCVIPGCNRIHTHSHEVDAQHSLHISGTHQTTLPSIYGNCTGNADLCVPYHKHCTSVSCNLQINNTTSLVSHTKANSPCERSHCTCLNCTYDIVTHCRQCIHSATDTHVSCIESTPYFLPAQQSSVQSSAVQEHDRSKSETVIEKLYDDQLLCKIEQNRLQTNSEKLEVQYDSKKMFRNDADNKLPLKKRLKMYAMMHEKLPIKAEKLDNYPAAPMMSIAALETSNIKQKGSTQILKTECEQSSTRKEDSHDSYHRNSSLVRRDYYKDVVSEHQNLTKENARKIECQFQLENEQCSGPESCLQQTGKAIAQRKEISLSELTSLKRYAMTPGQEGTYKNGKKTQSPLRQTRSSKRNVPKVNYSYTDADPEWNPSRESKRKRKKTSR